MSAVWGPPPEFVDFSAVMQPEGRSLHVVVEDWVPTEEPSLVRVTLMVRLGPNVKAPVSSE